MASIARMARSPKVEHIDDERSIGNGVIITLKQGWTWTRGEDNRVRGEESIFDMSHALKSEVYAFSGPYTD